MRLTLRHKVAIVLVSVMILQVVGLSMVSAAPAAVGGMPGPVPIFHLVRPGETLFSIGRMYGVNPWEIGLTNGIPNPNLIFAGQVLVIYPHPPAPPMPPAPQPYPGAWAPFPPFPQPFPGGWGGCTQFHTVSSGQTLFSIAQMYGVSVWAIAQANGLLNPNLIFTGQVLCIPAPGPLPMV